jgi:hypothetical protein
MPQYSGIWTLGQAAQAIKNQDWAGVPPTVVEYLIVAGGGGGGFATNAAGGGGAGGLLQGFAGVVPGASYFVTVGSGGTFSNTINVAGSLGGNSVFDATSSNATTGRIVATGGGGGGSGYGNTNGFPTSGGSGGGGWSIDNATLSLSGSVGASGISGQGNAGGSGFFATSGYGAGGGGGGAGTVGISGTSQTAPGTGGAGIASDITGTRATYAGGGAGGNDNRSGNTVTAKGGAGGGGNGGAGSTAATAATSNTGGGGGGGGAGPGASTNGGSGIVVIRYPGNVQYFTGGTLNYSNGFMVHTFYSSGTLTPIAPRLFATPDYQIQRSIRFNSPDGPLLERAGSAGGNRKTWTWSGWIKRSKLNSNNTNVPFLFGASDRATGSAYLQFGTYGSDSAVDCLSFNEQSGGSYKIITQAKFRDTSAWYHVVCAYDTTQAVASDRIKIYINGILQTTTSDSTYPPQNNDGYVNFSSFPYLIGAYDTGSVNYTFGGYMTEINFVDGQQLTPASFGYTEPSTGVWTPLQYTGSYGTRGFYLNFADNSNTTAATLGKDLSGNANNFTPYNFSVSAGVGNDSFVDTPTNYGVDTGLGGEVRGNYATFNPVSKDSDLTLLNGNLDYSSSTNADDAFATMGFASGKWYFEFTPTLIPTLVQIGVATNQNLVSDGWLSNSVSYRSDGQKYVNGTASAYGATFVANDVIGIAVDIDNNLITFYKNNASQGAISYTFTGLTAFPVFRLGNTGGTGNSNFGQRAFAYTAPSGYKALCTQNLPESQAGKLPNKYFGVATYAADGGNQRPIVTSVDMTTYGGLAWFKSRNVAAISYLIDTVRGLTKYFTSINSTVEDTYDSGSVVKPYGLDINSGSVAVNQPGQGYNYVMWNWAAGGSAVTNTAGSITSSVSANPAAGFSIVTFTEQSSGTSTIGHGLGVAPAMMIIRERNSVSTWVVYHQSLGNTQFLALNETSAATTLSTIWNNTSPSSTVFTLGSNWAYSNNNIAYCWAEIAGYSRFGSYVGNGSADGPFVYCGFRPKYILIKRTDSNAAGPDWYVFDAARNTYNDGALGNMFINTSNSESIGWPIDFVSNGFKIRYSGATNYSGGSHIFAAFAESPFKYARAR